MIMLILCVFLAMQKCRLKLNHSQMLCQQVHLLNIFLLLVTTYILKCLRPCYCCVCPPGFDVLLLDDLLIVTIHGHDEDEPTEYVGMRQQQQQHNTNQQLECVSTVKEVSPEDAINNKKCIVIYIKIIHRHRL